MEWSIEFHTRALADLPSCYLVGVTSVKGTRSLCVWRQVGLQNLLNVVVGRRSNCYVDLAALVIRDCQRFTNYVHLIIHEYTVY